MNGAHDMGGMMGFGPVVEETDEPNFHHDWQRRAFAMTLAMAGPGGWNIDQSRSARESRAPAAYLSKSYYELWAAGLEEMLLARGLLKPGEVEAGHADLPAPPVERVLTADRVLPALVRGNPYLREQEGEPRFAAGETVRARILNPPGHTRLPRYVRGRAGMIELNHGRHVFPDSSAAGAGEAPQWLYTVRFRGTDLWGADADPTVSVSVDAFESYLERA